MELELAKVGERLGVKGMTVDVKEKAKELLAEQGFDPNLGARPLRRVIQRKVLDPLSLKIVAGEVKPGEKISVDAKDGEIVIAGATFGSLRMPVQKLEKSVSK